MQFFDFQRSETYKLGLWLARRLDGPLGQDARRAGQLAEALRVARQETLMVRQEVEQWVSYADEELHRLRSQNQAFSMAQEEWLMGNAELLAELHEVQGELLWHQRKLAAWEAKQRRQAKQVSLDLSGWKIAVVGGHDATRRDVGQVLKKRYGLKDYVEIPPLWEAKASQAQVRAKLAGCDLIVLVAWYSSHPLTQSVMRLKEKGALGGEVLPVNCRGVSGVTREIVEFVERGGPGGPLMRKGA